MPTKMFLMMLGSPAIISASTQTAITGILTAAYVAGMGDLADPITASGPLGFGQLVVQPSSTRTSTN